MANALTAIRLLLVVPIGLLLASPDGRAPLLAALAVAVAIATDLADGPVARRTGAASRFGGVFDHTTDFLFVTCGLAGGAARGVFPWLLPVLVVAAFTQYVVDSYWLHRHRGLRGSRLGRYNGILYFVPISGDTLTRLGLQFLRPAVSLVCWLLVLSTIVSMAQRLQMSVTQWHRRDPESPVGGTAGRLPR